MHQRAGFGTLKVAKSRFCNLKGAPDCGAAHITCAVAPYPAHMVELESSPLCQGER